MILEDSSINEVSMLNDKEELCEKESLAKGHSEEHSLTSNSTSPSDSGICEEPATDKASKESKLVGKSESDEDSRPALVEVSNVDEEEETGPASHEQLRGSLHDDDKSQASASTLLSDLSSIDEKPELDRLEDDFELRNRLRKKVIAEKGPEYLRIINEYEESMRKALREHYEEKAIQDRKRCLKRKQCKGSTPSYLERISEALLLNETARGCASILLYCVAHLSCWEITTNCSL